MSLLPPPQPDDWKVLAALAAIPAGALALALVLMQIFP